MEKSNLHYDEQTKIIDSSIYEETQFGAII
jgi:hypothetical protein